MKIWNPLKKLEFSGALERMHNVGKLPTTVFIFFKKIHEGLFTFRHRKPALKKSR